MAVKARVLTTDPVLNIRLAREGVGLNIAWERRVRDSVEQGELMVVLDEFCPPLPGVVPPLSRRRHAPPALRALIDYLIGGRNGESQHLRG